MSHAFLRDGSVIVVEFDATDRVQVFYWDVVVTGIKPPGDPPRPPSLDDVILHPPGIASAGADIRIRFELAKPVSLVKIQIYDVAGRLVRTLDVPHQAVGLHTVHWDGRNDRGTLVASGVYLIRLSADLKVRTGKIVIVR